MIFYLTSTTFVWLGCIILYEWLLGKETFFNINRYFLLGSTIAGLILPLIIFLPQPLITFKFSAVLPTIVIAPETNIQFSDMTPWLSMAIERIIVGLYLIGSGLVLFRLISGLTKIKSIKSKAKPIKVHGIPVLASEEVNQPFSFLSDIFVPKTIKSFKGIGQILQHESVHISQRHSWDIMFLRILKIFLWWHPAIYYFNNRLKLIHEYIADDVVTRSSDHKNYGQILLGFSSTYAELALTHQFFNSQLKNRILMLNKKKSAEIKMLKYLALVPFLLVVMIFFSSQIHAGHIDTNDPLTKSGLEITKPQDGQTSDPIYKVVEQMPRFPGCEDVSDNAARKECANKKMFEFILKEMKYPEEAQKKNIEGTALIQFVVDTDGTLKDITIKRDLKGGCGKEAKRVVEKMNDMPKKWIPGKQKGKKVKVEMILPFKFKL